MSEKKLRGILLPFPTPFGEDGEVDARAVRSNIRRWNETGVSGYVALGSTGERAHLDERERAALVEAARGEIPVGIGFIVGAGEQSTRATVAEARRVAAQGADALLVITPHFYRAAMTAEALFRHFSEVADASPVPVVLYSIPQNAEGGLGVAPKLAARLAAHGNIVGIKDSSGDLLNLAETVRLVGERDDFAVTIGHAGALYAALAAGARGAILAAACAVPELCVEIYARVAAGDHARSAWASKSSSRRSRAPSRRGHRHRRTQGRARPQRQRLRRRRGARPARRARRSSAQGDRAPPRSRGGILAFRFWIEATVDD